MRYNAFGFREKSGGEVYFCAGCLINITLPLHIHVWPLRVNYVLWAAHQEDGYCSWQGTWISNYQILDLIAITWTPRQGELLEKNVISETGTLLPTPCLDTNTEHNPDKHIYKDKPSVDKNSLKVNYVQVWC